MPCQKYDHTSSQPYFSQCNSPKLVLFIYLSDLTQTPPNPTILTPPKSISFAVLYSLLSYPFFIFPQIFSKAKIFFSIGGQFYNGPSLSFSHASDKVMESARNVTIDLYQKLAKFVKIRLYFADKRIMLSEVVFESGK